ncbi:MAG: hypothetical protein KJ069_16295 [Anaerolineae bacterium]|nr:hypothetical protein [Anaerolineae bacterium]
MDTILMDRQTNELTKISTIYDRHPDIFFEVVPDMKGTIDRPVHHLNGWTYFPLDQNISFVPNFAFDRVDMLRDAGIEIIQLIVGHEPVEEVVVQPQPAREPFDWSRVWDFLYTAGMVLGTITVAVASIALMVALSDPTLIIVTRSGQWIQVARWVE